MMPDNGGAKLDLEALLARRPATLVGKLMILAMHSLMLSVVIDLYHGTHGMARFWGVQATILALNLVPVLIVVVERWHDGGK